MPPRKDFAARMRDSTAERRDDALNLYFQQPAVSEPELPPPAPSQPELPPPAPSQRAKPQLREGAKAPDDAPSPSAPPPDERRSRQERQQLTFVGTYLAAELEGRLHLLAYERGGESEKSGIVRQALHAWLTRFEQQSDPAASLAEVRAELPQSGFAPRLYRIEPEIKERLQHMAAIHRVPMAAVVRAALRRYLEQHEVGEPPAG